MTKEIFVFGSNLAGRHGSGAARYAVLNHGAIYGQGIGLQGTSYAIPTKDHNIQTLPLFEIKKYVDAFIQVAHNNPELIFMVTAIGTGLAGLKSEEVAPMFSQVPSNVKLPKVFLDVLYGENNYSPDLMSFDW